MQKTTQAPWKTFVPVPALGLLTLETFAWIPSFPPMNALDPSSYIFLHHHLLSLLTDWDPQLGCTVHVIIVVGEILSAAMSTTINQRKLNALLNMPKSLGCVPLGTVQDFAVIKQCSAVECLPRTLCWAM